MAGRAVERLEKPAGRRAVAGLVQWSGGPGAADAEERWTTPPQAALAELLAHVLTCAGAGDIRLLPSGQYWPKLHRSQW